MIVRLIFIILLFLSLFLETSVLAFPCVVLFSLLFFFFFDEIGTYMIIFVASLLLDSFMLRSLGFTALYLFVFIGIF
ncbi:MAG: hypothetical protein ACHQT7_01955, partial [Candidatus Levyibacteriota bacterium]